MVQNHFPWALTAWIVLEPRRPPCSACLTAFTTALRFPLLVNMNHPPSNGAPPTAPVMHPAQYHQAAAYVQQQRGYQGLGGPPPQQGGRPALAPLPPARDATHPDYTGSLYQLIGSSAENDSDRLDEKLFEGRLRMALLAATKVQQSPSSTSRCCTRRRRRCATAACWKPT
jgi:hypothetical protein